MTKLCLVVIVAVIRSSFHKNITNASIGTANAWHFYYVFAFLITVLCGELILVLSAP